MQRSTIVSVAVFLIAVFLIVVVQVSVLNCQPTRARTLPQEGVWIRGGEQLILFPDSSFLYRLRLDDRDSIAMTTAGVAYVQDGILTLTSRMEVLEDLSDSKVIHGELAHRVIKIDKKSFEREWKRVADHSDFFNEPPREWTDRSKQKSLKSGRMSP